MFLKKNLKQNRKFFTLFPLVVMHSIMFPMIHEVFSSDDYLSCTASSGNTGCPKVWLRWVKCHMLQSKLVMILGKSFTTSEQSGVCSQLQEDPPVPLCLPGYNLPVSCVSSLLHSRGSGWSFFFKYLEICFSFLWPLSDPVCLGGTRQTGHYPSCSPHPL